MDDHIFMRDLISRELTRTEKHFDVVATAASAAAACRRYEPHLLVLDINLPDRTGDAAVPDIRRVSPATRILLCTAFPKGDWLDEATASGADGFVEKTNSWDDFMSAVDHVSRGQRHFCADGKRDFRQAKEQRNAVRLTPCEREILKLIAHGLTTKEIATKLFISIPTVETHRSNLYE